VSWGTKTLAYLHTHLAHGGGQPGQPDDESVHPAIATRDAENARQIATERGTQSLCVMILIAPCSPLHHDYDVVSGTWSSA
jgi:hypothetical protein